MSKPATMSRDETAVYAWLKANNIDEWIPENPTIVVDKTANSITCSAFQWSGPRGWDAEHMKVGKDGKDGKVATERRLVKLIQVPDAKVIEAAGRAGATITVVG
jgi:hypothetical protein